jgi:uncharacterized protein (TIGR02996 family)
MTPDDAFLADIIENPDDNSVRLIYADYLDERDDPRGEFIRVQIELSTMPQDNPQWPRLKTRERQLQEHHEWKWVGPMADLVLDWWFYRGFVEAIKIDANNLLRHADTVFGFVPIREVWLRAAERTIPRLALCAHLARLTALHLDDCLIRDDGLQRLLASPHLRSLRTLGLANTGLRGDGLRALGAWSPLAELTSLHLAGNSLGDAVVEAFLKSPQLARLRYADFSGNPISQSLQETVKQRFGRRAYWYQPAVEEPDNDE